MFDIPSFFVLTAALLCVCSTCRKKAKLQGQFKGMVRGAHKGAMAAKRMRKNKK